MQARENSFNLILGHVLGRKKAFLLLFRFVTGNCEWVAQIRKTKQATSMRRQTDFRLNEGHANYCHSY